MSTAISQTTYLELTKHTLLIARASGGYIELYRECAFDDKPAVEETLAAFEAEWKTGGLRAVSALHPTPTHWHLATAEEAPRHRTEESLRKFSATLPHHLKGKLELTACHAADGARLSPQGSARWLLGLTPADSITLAVAAASEWRIEPARIESSTLSHLGAIATLLQAAGKGSVLLWDLSADRSQLFLVTIQGVEAVIPCAMGLEEILNGVQTAAALKFRNTAVRLFYNANHDFSEVGPKIAAHAAAALRAAFESLPAGDTPPAFACTGLTGGQAWFVREAALTLGLQPWAPDLSAVFTQFGLQVDPATIVAPLPTASLGLLHYISSLAHNDPSWHPAWTRAGVIPLAVAPAPVAATIATLPKPAAPPAPKISERTIACLRDEAYATLCRESLTDALAQTAVKKQELISSRPPFGMLGSKKARDAYETSLNTATHTEAEYRLKLQQVDQLEHWLQSTIQEGLHEYLTAGSAEYQGYNEISTLVERWQNALGGLHELVLALARDARATAAAVNSHAGGRNGQLQVVASLREIATNLHAEILKIARISNEVARLAAGKIPTASLLPALPAFRHGGWVDQVILLTPAECVRELQLCEAEARAFCGGGKNDLLLRAESTRSASLRTRLEYLNKYWDQLRAHALQHYVEARDVDEVLAELTRHYVGADLKRRQREVGTDPFAIAR